MFRLDKIIKPWKDAASLSANVNLYGFWNETTFLTKSGDLGIVLKVCGVDFENLDQAGQELAVRRLEAALKSFGPGFHVYQYLFKTNRPDMPFAKYGDPLIDAAVEQRREFFESKRDRLYSIEIFYAVVLEGARSKTGIAAALGRFPSDPSGAWRELKAQFTGDNMKVLLREQIDRDHDRLQQRVEAFRQHIGDLVDIEILSQADQFHFFRRLLNFDDWRIDGRPQATQYLDYQVVNSDITADRDHLRVGDHFVRLLTMREAISVTHPLVLDRLLKIEANFYAVTEWTPLATDAAKKEVVKRRRHANVSKSGFISSMKDESKVNHPQQQPRRSCRMKNVVLTLALALAASSSAALAQITVPPASAEQARTVQYHSQDIVPIRAKVKYTTLIVVPATEKIMEAATGDKDFWIVDVVGSFCFVHPAKPNISSNLNLITDKGNIYSFTLQDISSIGGDPDLKVIIQPADRSSISVSCASHDAHIYTNDAAALGERLSTNVSKASAVRLESAPSETRSQESVERKEAMTTNSKEQSQEEQRRQFQTEVQSTQQPTKDAAEQSDARHYAPIQTALRHEAVGYDWKRETADIQSYQHKDHHGWLHIDSHGGFHDRQAHPISRESALENAGHTHSPTILNEGQSRSLTNSNDQGHGL